ncbi:MAG: hypothetical protein ACE5F1_15945, partial [Planctomycetota bacterium]
MQLGPSNSRERGRGRLGRARGRQLQARACVVLAVCLAGCGILPDEFNVSPLYRHRVGPDGRLAEFDLLWPLFHYERDEAGTTDFRVRPIWRRVEDATATRIRHEFVSPLGAYRTDGRETAVRFLPLFYYREHEHEGRPGSWDRDWFFTPLIWGGSSAEGEDYLAVIPVFGSIRQFLGYDRLGFFLFPLSLWTSRGSSRSFSFLWPLMGWGGSAGRDEHGKPTHPYWFRILPFFGYSIHPGKSESYSALWPFFHWGTERMDSKEPYSKFYFFPILGWRTGGAFLSWHFLWPLFRHTHKVAGRGGSGAGDYSSWDFPWPLFRSLDNTWRGADLHQWWIFPLISKTWSRTKESLVLLWPLIRFRRFFDALSERCDSFILPLYWSYRTRYKRIPAADSTPDAGEETEEHPRSGFLKGEDRGWRVLPLAGYREERTGTWRYR